jgi:hypothetical protein
MIVDVLSTVNKQVSWFAAKDGENVHFTMTGARISTKPFVIGFIPPDDPVDFIPIAQKKARLRKLPIDLVAQDQSGKRAVRVNRVDYGKKEEVAYENKGFSPSDLRKAYFAAGKKVLGMEPSEEFVCFLFGQARNEIGCTADRPGCGAPVYNLGGVHGSTKQLKLADPCDRKSEVVSSDEEKEKAQPKTGKFYLKTDTFGTPGNCSNGKRCENLITPGDRKQGLNRCAFGVYFKGYKNLEEGAASKIQFVASGYPEAIFAKTPEEYVQKICPKGATGQGTCYFDWRAMDDYTQGVKKGCDTYQKKFLGKEGAIQPDSPEEEAATPEETLDVVMKNSDAAETTITEDDTYFRTGRDIEVDETRLSSVYEQVTALKQQIDIFNRTPPLVLLINPQEFNRNYERAVDDGNKGRQKNIVHMWLERPMTLSASGQTAAQYVLNADNTGGLTHHKRIHSLSYLNLMSLVQIYKNNGVIYTNLPENEGVAVLPMSIFIYYDNHLYIGSFDDFEVSDSGDKPFNLSYSFKFTVRYDMETTLSAGKAPTIPDSIEDKIGTVDVEAEIAAEEKAANTQLFKFYTEELGLSETEAIEQIQQSQTQPSEETLKQFEENLLSGKLNSFNGEDVVFPSDNKTTKTNKTSGSGKANTDLLNKFKRAFGD